MFNEKEWKHTWYVKNKKTLLAKNKKWRDAHPAKMAEYRARWITAHPDKNKAAKAKWQATNLDKHVAMQTKRRAKKLNAVPAWANVEIIKEFYVEAKYQGLCVDHIVPISSKFVCGLHVEHNLQLLSIEDNCKKGNKVWPDMWSN